jgi:MSHA pilin protein MshA
MTKARAATARRTAGFTLIELVITISVIAILAAVALPRYITLQTQARTAKAQAIYGGVRSAGALAHAQAIATNTTSSGAATIQMEGVNVTLMNGYPTADAAGIVTALQIDATADQVTITPGGGATALTLDIAGGTSPNCRVSYTEAPSGNTSPTVAVTTTGC